MLQGSTFEKERFVLAHHHRSTWQSKAAHLVVAAEQRKDSGKKYINFTPIILCNLENSEPMCELVHW